MERIYHTMWKEINLNLHDNVFMIDPSELQKMPKIIDGNNFINHNSYFLFYSSSLCDAAFPQLMLHHLD